MSGLRRSVPRPLQGASTSTRSILPASRFTRASFAPSSRCGCTLESPERARRGFSPASRFGEMSNAYRRPVERISAPSARVLPPAPAQKSTTISPRLGATRWQSSWLPSSCTSTPPSRNSGCRLIAGFSSSLIPSGEYGVAAARSPSAASRSIAVSREIFIGFTRRSRGAFCSRPLARASSALLSWRARRRSITQSGSSHSTSRGCGACASCLTEASHWASSPRSQGSSSRRFAPRSAVQVASARRRGLCVAATRSRSRRRLSAAYTDSAMVARSRWPILG